jgi:predicted adenine nucleotide alpha hydrolase (AANH) superfamily ATPase
MSFRCWKPYSGRIASKKGKATEKSLQLLTSILRRLIPSKNTCNLKTCALHIESGNNRVKLKVRE